MPVKGVSLLSLPSNRVDKTRGRSARQAVRSKLGEQEQVVRLALRRESWHAYKSNHWILESSPIRLCLDCYVHTYEGGDETYMCTHRPDSVAI